MAILHRPLFPGTRPEETACQAASRVVDLDHESIWISYCPMALNGPEPGHLGLLIASSAGRPSITLGAAQDRRRRSAHPDAYGWLIVYHGVSEIEKASNDEHQLCYSAGVMVLSKEHPQVIRYRSVAPVLSPTLPQECSGTVAHVVFPTGIDRRDDLGLPNRFDVYYGMADSRIGVARLDMRMSCRRKESQTHRKQRYNAFDLSGGKTALGGVNPLTPLPLFRGQIHPTVLACPQRLAPRGSPFCCKHVGNNIQRLLVV